MKYLGVNLTKSVKDLYAENYKTSMRDILCSWIGRPNWATQVSHNQLIFDKGVKAT